MGVVRFKKNIILVLILLIVSSTIHCSPKGQVVKESDEAVLKRRVQEYWTYRIKGQLDKSYLYEAPEYKEKMDLVRYITLYGRGTVRWEGFEIMELWASGEEGYVRLNAKARYQIPKFQEYVFDRVIEEKWIKKEGQWYHYDAVS